MSHDELLEALRALIRGEGVGRASHSLRLEGHDLTPVFCSLLESEGYVEQPVDSIEISLGERVPAFRIEGDVCHFGWVFWELFQPGRRRKLFGSATKNAKGDWALMLGRSARVHANQRLKETMDVERPPSL